ncbi:hypothetical protein ACTVT5_13460, partial [Staphylococcus aureus]
FLCRVDGKGKGFTLGRSIAIPITKSWSCPGDIISSSALTRALLGRDRLSLSWDSSVQRYP